MTPKRLLILGLLCCTIEAHLSSACRVNSEQLKSYTQKSIEKLLQVDQLKSIYWPEEPLNVGSLSKVAGLNITFAETQFNLGGNEKSSNESKNEIGVQQVALLHDIFVTCSADRHHTYTLTINLELNNPFKVINLQFEQEQQEMGSFRIHLAQSTFLVQLNQRISYDECLDVKYIQLGPNVNYEVECLSCDEKQQVYLDKIFSKKMTQFDAELDSILSEKLLLGLQVLLNQQRLDLDLFMNHSNNNNNINSN